jgi:hypothetical protein
MANPKMHLGERKKPANEMEGHGGHGDPESSSSWNWSGFVLMPPMRKKSAMVTEDEDEDHPQRAHLPLSGPCRSLK